MESLRDRIESLEKSGGLSKEQRAFLALPPEEREDLKAVTRAVLEAIYRIFVGRFPETRELRFRIYEPSDKGKPIVVKRLIIEWLQRLSSRERKTFRMISQSVSRALIEWQKSD